MLNIVLINHYFLFIIMLILLSRILNLEGIFAFNETLKYLSNIGMENIEKREKELRINYDGIVLKQFYKADFVWNGNAKYYDYYHFI